VGSVLGGAWERAGRYRDLGQQRLVAGYARRGGGTDPLCRHTERRAYLERKFGAQLLGL